MIDFKLITSLYLKRNKLFFQSYNINLALTHKLPVIHWLAHIQKEE